VEQARHEEESTRQRGACNPGPPLPLLFALLAVGSCRVSPQFFHWNACAIVRRHSRCTPFVSSGSSHFRGCSSGSLVHHQCYRRTFRVNAVLRIGLPHQLLFRARFHRVIRHAHHPLHHAIRLPSHRYRDGRVDGPKAKRYQPTGREQRFTFDYAGPKLCFATFSDGDPGAFCLCGAPGCVACWLPGYCVGSGSGHQPSRSSN
jgi:hypothetical protein